MKQHNLLLTVVSRLPSLVAMVALILLLSQEGRPAWSQQVVVVCPDQFESAAKHWIRHRQQQGMSVARVIPKERARDTKREVLLAFEELEKVHPTSVKPSSHHDHKQARRYLFLIGDTPTIGTVCDTSRSIPTFYLNSKVTLQWNSTPTIPTDFPYSDMDEDGIPEIAVGRLPVDRVSQFENWLRRLWLREETNEFGDWFSEVQLVGGVGGFGFLADRAIESVARTVVTGVLPTEVRTRVLYGSPGHRFFPNNSTFTEAVVSDFSKGARFWVYAGHGQVTELDRVPPKRDGTPVLDRRSIQQLACRNQHAPIALLLACYTGALDAAEDCIAEEMLFVNGGPIAAIAGSRVTMPYGNASLAVGLIQSIYTERHPRFGDNWLQMQRSLGEETASVEQSARVLIDGLATLLSPAGSTLAEERREHVLLYQLLGDPTQSISHAEKLVIDTAAGVDPGEPVSVALTSPLAGELVLRVDRPLGSITQGDPNETGLLRLVIPMEANQQSTATLKLPQGVTGPLVIRAQVIAKNRIAVGATKTIVRQ